MDVHVQCILDMTLLYNVHTRKFCWLDSEQVNSLQLYKHAKFEFCCECKSCQMQFENDHLKELHSVLCCIALSGLRLMYMYIHVQSLYYSTYTAQWRGVKALPDDSSSHFC